MSQCSWTTYGDLVSGFVPAKTSTSAQPERSLVGRPSDEFRHPAVGSAHSVVPIPRENFQLRLPPYSRRFPAGRTLFERIVGQHANIRAIGTHDGDFAIRLWISRMEDRFVLEALATACERDPFAIG